MLQKSRCLCLLTASVMLSYSVWMKGRKSVKFTVWVDAGPCMPRQGSSVGGGLCLFNMVCKIKNQLYLIFKNSFPLLVLFCCPSHSHFFSKMSQPNSCVGLGEQHYEGKQGWKLIQTLRLIMQRFCLFLVILIKSRKYIILSNIIALNQLSFA